MKLTNEQLEAAACAAETWPERRYAADRSLIDEEVYENSGDLECLHTWFLPGQGGWPALEACFSVWEDSERIIENFNREGIIKLESLDLDKAIQASETLDALSEISPGYFSTIETQSGADYVALLFRNAKS